MSMTYEPIEIVEENPGLTRQAYPGRTLTRLPSRHDAPPAPPSTAPSAPPYIATKAQGESRPASLPSHTRPTHNRAKASVTMDDLRLQAVDAIAGSRTIQEAGTKYMEYLTEVNPERDALKEQMAIDAILTAKFASRYEHLRGEFARATQSWVQMKKYISSKVLEKYQGEQDANTLELTL